jgi:hypothetical protein
MEAVLSGVPEGRKRFSWVVFAWIMAALILLGVGVGIKAAMNKEVPLKPCGTCVVCPCPTGLNGPRCGCPR